ncbi:MAG: hypothetical protein KatS3mg055_2628 [Chloroflexus sp.]|nr:MAG: hypothetical protein KatS3mg055_2628 [Chloroflexus sp.]
MLWACPITGVESVGLCNDDDDIGATHRVAPIPIRPVRWYVVGMPHHGRGIGWIVDDDDDVGATHRVAPIPIRPVRWYVVVMPHHGRGIGWIVR